MPPPQQQSSSSSSPPCSDLHAYAARSVPTVSGGQRESLLLFCRPSERATHCSGTVPHADRTAAYRCARSSSDLWKEIRAATVYYVVANLVCFGAQQWQHAWLYHPHFLYIISIYHISRFWSNISTSIYAACTRDQTSALIMAWSLRRILHLASYGPFGIASRAASRAASQLE
jgi:hypothetical protein